MLLRWCRFWRSVAGGEALLLVCGGHGGAQVVALRTARGWHFAVQIWLQWWCAEQASRRLLLFVVAGRGATMVREGCGNGGCYFRRVAVVAGEEMAAAAAMVGGREIRVRVSCVRWRR